MNHAYLITGSNMGERGANLAMATHWLEERCGTVIDRSAVYETEPWGNEHQPPFLNQVLMLDTMLGARELLDNLLAIERQMGRERTEPNGPRLIDIDLLLFNHEVIRQPGLVVPHPRMAGRRFVLQPLSDVAPAYIHPVLRKTLKQLLDECADTLQVKRLEA